MGIDNRINVALSRAKNALYIFGNATVLRDHQLNLKKRKIKKTTIWTKILKFMIEKDYMKESIIIECVNHKKIIEIKEIKDFEKCPEGGCRQICSLRMECGHSCKRFCHVYEISHNNKDGHKDSKSRCFEKCDQIHKYKTQCCDCKKNGVKKCEVKVEIHLNKCM